MPLLLEFMKTQRMHGSGGRQGQIMDWLVQYGSQAQTMLPALEEYLAFLEQDHPWIDRGRPETEGFYKSQIPFVKEAIQAIQTADTGVEMKTITPYLEQP